MINPRNSRSNSVVWTIAAKEVRLLARDPKAGLILLAMPFVFIVVVCLSVGEGFGQKPDDRLRVSIVDLDEGYVDPDSLVREQVAWLCPPLPGIGLSLGFDTSLLTSVAVSEQVKAQRFPKEAWSKIVKRDMTDSDINVELIETTEEAHKLVSAGKRAAVVVFGPKFSRQVQISSFLATGINPFYREGVKLSELDAEVISDPTQVTASSIIKQVAQVSMLRVILPWMIGRAFEKLSEPSFMTMLAEEVPGGKLLPGNIKTSPGSGVQGAAEAAVSARHTSSLARRGLRLPSRRHDRTAARRRRFTTTKASGFPSEAPFVTRFWCRLTRLRSPTFSSSRSGGSLPVNAARER